ncbi:aromatic ring-hydroxylating dioxygenase subunit alpha [Zhongshania sp. BJYM1]|uniref:aromatic ring-hydroxylating dioxygenase subunit alpha n=1 Tax=Zhongshania aquatica TaxID=2965069 RepID=UPI0022B2E5B6|nr:aromatic ring-hydroxylating dioxygenase subunit alpha [Marortus sp. BJYM1]
MFLKNAWYCGGWQTDLSLAKDALLTRKIADEFIVFYRKADGNVVALEDRCCHRQAPLSLGRKEGDNLRCMYHGWKFDSTGLCVEIPGQQEVRNKACVRSFPVVVKNDWIWVWMGDPAIADESLICDSVGPSHPEWDLRTKQVRVNTNYRLEIANLTDLSHVAWVHANSFGGTTAYVDIRPKHTLGERGLHTEFWLRNVPAPEFARHLFPPEARFDFHFDVNVTVPCNFILSFKVFTSSSASEGASEGELILNTFSSQAVTPRDEDEVDYYYSWGATKHSTVPGLVELLIEANEVAFLEDKRMLEGQYERIKHKSDVNPQHYAHDLGPVKMLRLLDTLLAKEQDDEQKNCQE